ncbi:FAD-binding protein [Burkholderiales bacterium]|jgi:glycolate oxidase|nr:FAD-binding protein [Betaproteobacteria bacterium]MBT6529569.1 FAD-binding protein [Betaproteobacteria bacterium]MDC1433284.1 FAD-binding protein [Burkholderiales bacterium]
MGHSEKDLQEYPISSTDKKTLVKAFLAILSEESVKHETEDLTPFECDGLSAYPQIPMIAVLPENEEQVCHVMKICNDHKVPVVFRGAGTGLSGGAIPYDQGVLLVLTKLKSIVQIDPLGRSAVVQPGVRNAAISEATKPYQLYYAPDPSSQIACSIGGNVAENSGGVHCLKYGLTVNNILKVRFVTIEGEIVELGSEGLDTPGYDLLALITGSEGLLGVVTEVTVKLLPTPEKAQVIMASFDDVEKAGLAVADIIAAGIIPAGLEMMDKKAVNAVEQFIGAGYPMGAEAMLLCESDGSSEEVESEIAKTSEVLTKAGATEITVSTDEAQRLKLWAGRKSAFPAVGRVLPDYFCMDGTIPRKTLPRVLKRIAEMEKEFQLQCANVFHAGDGNLHPLIMFDANEGDQLHRAELYGAAILELCVEVGGTITGEHGVGIEKINQMCVQFDNHEIQTFLDLKSAFDPDRRLNPGKAIPTLNRCAEFGHMHVHRGEERFPDIPRF